MNKHIYVWRGMEDKYRFYIKNSKIAKKLNKHLKYFPDDTKFGKDSEAVFSVNIAQLESVLSLLNATHEIIPK